MPNRPTPVPGWRPSWWLLACVLVLLAALVVEVGWRQPSATTLSSLTMQDVPAAPTVAETADVAQHSDAVETSVTPTSAASGLPSPSLATRQAVADTVQSTATPVPTTVPNAPAPVPTSTPVPVVPSPTATPALVMGPPRIGLQAGHWRAHELPEELSRLRGASGGSGGGRQEWEFNLEVAEWVAERLRAQGYLVDVLPATIPPGYQADVFLSIHADANVSPAPRGFKVARSGWSRLPATDDALVRALTEEYGRATGLPWDDGITRNMTRYYAFNNRRRQYAIDKTTPGAIIEMGFLTNAADRSLLFNRTELVVEGITRGLVRFLEERPPLAEREQPATIGTAIIINDGGATARAGPSFDAAVMAQLDGGLRQDAPEVRGEWYGVWVAQRNGPGWVHQSEARLIQIPLP